MKLYHFLFLLCTPFLSGCSTICYDVLPSSVFIVGYPDSDIKKVVIYAVDKGNGMVIDSSKYPPFLFGPSTSGSGFNLPRSSGQFQYDYRIKIGIYDTHTLSDFVYRKKDCETGLFEPKRSELTMIGYSLNSTYVQMLPGKGIIEITKP